MIQYLKTPDKCVDSSALKIGDHTKNGVGVLIEDYNYFDDALTSKHLPYEAACIKYKMGSVVLSRCGECIKFSQFSEFLKTTCPNIDASEKVKVHKGETVAFQFCFQTKRFEQQIKNLCEARVSVDRDISHPSTAFNLATFRTDIDWPRLSDMNVLKWEHISFLKYDYSDLFHQYFDVVLQDCVSRRKPLLLLAEGAEVVEACYDFYRVKNAVKLEVYFSTNKRQIILLEA